MTTNPISKHPAAALIAIVLLGIGCSESYRSTMAENPVPAVDAVLIVSDSAPAVGGTLVVAVRASVTHGTVGSYTARINYDSTALRYDGEVAMNDNGARASNPTPGLLRFAGAAATGFAEGRLASYRFSVLRPNSVSTLALAVDEMHMIDRVDAKSRLTVSAVRMTPR
jgi:hypothetical protein